MRPDVVRLGGFDSHTFPPTPLRLVVHAPAPAPPSAARRRAACLAALLLALAATPGASAAQQRDSVRAGVATTRRDTAVTLQLPQPPLSPRRAFLTSLLLPGYAQARLNRPTASAVFFGIEAASVMMLGKTLHDLRVAKRFRADSVPLQYAVDATTGLVRRDENGAPVVQTWTRGRYTMDLVRARRLQREDWVAVLLFNHLFAGADAFVSAHLWDLPAAVDVSATGRGGAVIAASFRW